MAHDDDFTTTRPANDSHDESPFTERRFFGAGYGLRKPLPDRSPVLDAPAVLAIELAIYRSGFTPAAQRLLVSILRHTCWRTHVCYRHRRFLLEQAGGGSVRGGLSARRSTMLITSWEKAGLLKRLRYDARHPDLRPGSIEWDEGAWFLRWEATNGEALGVALRSAALGGARRAGSR